MTRHGKIARLPHEIREELNQRLYNGALSPELLPWLNELPAVKELLAKCFDASPINKQNLTEWRQGGYQDWLHHQERELRIQRIAEEGSELSTAEGREDLFENAARIAIAELMTAMDSLADMEDKERWERLRSLTRELVQLQNGYNRSRWADLAWHRWNHRFLGPKDYRQPSAKIAKVEIPASAPQPAAKETTAPQQPAPHTPNPCTSPTVKVDQTKSTGEGDLPVPPTPRPAVLLLEPPRAPAETPFDSTADFLRQAAHRRAMMGNGMNLRE